MKRFTHLLLAILMTVGLAMESSANVQAAPPIPNVHISPAVVTGADGKIYVMGGLTADEQYVLSAVDVFDPTTNTWSAGVPLPAPRQQFSAVSGSDGSIYVMGGYSSDGFTTSVIRFNPTTRTWSEVNPLSNQRNHFASVATRDGKIYAVGGEWRQYEWIEYANFVDVFDSATGDWTAINKKFTARNRLAAGVDRQGRIYALGGMIMNYTPFRGSVNVVEMFDPSTSEWTAKANMLDDRAEFAAATGNDGKIYAFGGMQGMYSPVCVSGCRFTVRNSAEVYDPESNQWTRLSQMPTGRISFGAATGANGLIYVVGGLDGHNAVRTLDIFDPATNVWTAGSAQ